MADLTIGELQEKSKCWCGCGQCSAERQLLATMKREEKLRDGIEGIYKWCFLDSLTRPEISRKLQSMIEKLRSEYRETEK